MFLEKTAAFALSCLAVLISGCVLYPVTPETHQYAVDDQLEFRYTKYLPILHPEIQGEESELDDSLDYEFIAKVERAISESKPNIQIINSSAFLKSVLSVEPKIESITVADLISLAKKRPGSSDAKPIVPHYLLLITGDTAQGGTGTYIPLLIGVGTTEPHTRMTALIVDWATGRVLEGIDSEAHARGGGLVWIVIPFGFFPETESKSASVLGELVSGKLTELKGSDSAKVLVLLGPPNKKNISSSADSQMQLYYSLAAENHVDAHRWLCRAADQGDPEARYRLGLLYENATEGFPRDYLRAYMWYALAAQSGNYWGKSNALRVRAEYLDSEEFAAAANVVERWAPGQCESDLGLLQSR